MAPARASNFPPLGAAGLKRWCRPARFVAVALVLQSWSCASMSSFEPASTLGRSNVSLSFRGAAQAATGSCTACPFVYEPLSGWQPNFQLAAGYGVTDWFDLRAAVGQAGVQLGGKLRVWPPEREAGVTVSLAPLLGGFSFPQTGGFNSMFNAELPVLIGVRATDAVEPVLALRVIDMLTVKEVGYQNLLGCGASIGASIRVEDGTFLMPELSVVRVPFVHARYMDTPAFVGRGELTGWLGQAGVAVRHVF